MFSGTCAVAPGSQDWAKMCHALAFQAETTTADIKRTRIRHCKQSTEVYLRCSSDTPDTSQWPIHPWPMSGPTSHTYLQTQRNRKEKKKKKTLFHCGGNRLKVDWNQGGTVLGNTVYNSLQAKQHALWRRAQFYRLKQCKVKILLTRTHCKREQEMRQEMQAAPRQEWNHTDMLL